MCENDVDFLTQEKEPDLSFLLHFSLLKQLCLILGVALASVIPGPSCSPFSVLLPPDLPSALIPDQRASVLRGVPRESLSVGLSLEEDSFTQDLHP